MAAIPCTTTTVDSPGDPPLSQADCGESNARASQCLPQEGGRSGDVFSDPALRAALQEMEALGLRVSDKPDKGAESYNILWGRSGSRWFLLPTRPLAVCASSLAFVQPVRFTSRVLRHCAVATARLGLSGLWFRRVAYVSGANRLAGVFGRETLYPAFFSGTAGPHRKLVVQCMNGAGRIRGYAKVACIPAVHALLEHEASIMQELDGIGLRTAVIPRVLLHEVRDGVAILAMDAVNATRNGSAAPLRAAHLSFLDELAARTGSAWASSGEALIRGWRARVKELAPRLSTAWQDRLQCALQRLAAEPELIASRGLAHGDFTPVNTFPYQDRLYVFDWEYAGGEYPADFDQIRYLGALPSMRAAQPARRVNVILHRLVGEFGRSEAEARCRLVAYQCIYALRGAARQPSQQSGHMPLTWESELDDAATLDVLLALPRSAELQG